MAEGFALHEIITDEQGRPIDFRFLDANAAYERHAADHNASATMRGHHAAGRSRTDRGLRPGRVDGQTADI